MAIHKSAYTGEYADNHQEFICDNRSDIAMLPTQTSGRDKCPTASKAFVIEDSSNWMLNSEGVWRQIFISGSGGSTGTVDDVDVATDNEVESMLDEVFLN